MNGEWKTLFTNDEKQKKECTGTESTNDGKETMEHVIHKLRKT